MQGGHHFPTHVQGREGRFGIRDGEYEGWDAIRGVMKGDQGENLEDKWGWLGQVLAAKWDEWEEEGQKGLQEADKAGLRCELSRGW